MTLCKKVSWLSAALVLGWLGAARADTGFEPGSLIIPLDACGQENSDPAYCTWSAGTCGNCSAVTCSYNAFGYPTGNNKLAFGAAYLLATNGIPIHVALSSTKSTLGDPDFVVTRPNASSVPAPVLAWNSAAPNPLDGGTGSYQIHTSWIASGTISMPYTSSAFIIDAAYAQDALRVLTWFNRFGLQTNPGSLNAFDGVVIHMAYNHFRAPIAAVLESRPRPVGVLNNGLDDYFGESGIRLVLDRNAPCSSDGQCPGNPGSTVSGKCNTSLGYCQADYWVQLNYTNGSSPASYSFNRSSSMPLAAGACTTGTCSQLTWDTGGGKIDRVLDALWMDALGNSADWVNWAGTPFGLDSFLAGGGRLFGIGTVGAQIENGTGSRQYMTAPSVRRPDNNDASDAGPFCWSYLTSPTTTANADSVVSPFPASNPYLQTGGLSYQTKGGGGLAGITRDPAASPASGSYGWDTWTQGIIDNSATFGVLADNPQIGSNRAGWVIYEGAVAAWHGGGQGHDAGLRLLFNTLINYTGKPGGTVDARFSSAEVSRSSLVGSPTDTHKYYGGTFAWSVPAALGVSGHNYFTPAIGVYPAATGHFREYNAALTSGFGGDCSSGTPCTWDAAVKIAGQGGRKVGVIDLSANKVLDWNDTSLDTDGAVVWMRSHLGASLGGIDFSTPAVIQPKQGPVNLGNAQKRPTLAYVGARDGMVHAICVRASGQALTSFADGTTSYAAGTCYGRAPGEEVWAILPRPSHRIMPNANAALSDWSAVNAGGVMRVADININPTGAPSWRTVLFFTTRSASATVNDSVTALDISDPDPLYIGQTSPVSLAVLWENDGTDVVPSAGYTTGTGCTNAKCPLGASAGGSIGQVGSSFYLMTTSATAASAGSSGINTYLFDASNGKIIGFSQLLYTSSSRAGLTNQPTRAPMNSITSLPIANDVPPIPTTLNPTLGAPDDTIVLVADIGGIVRRFNLPTGNPSTIASTSNGLSNITTIFSTHNKDQAYSNSTGSHTYNPTGTPVCPTVGAITNTACQPIGAPLAIIKDAAVSPNFFAVVATGGADSASSDAINQVNTPFYIHYLDPQGLGPTSTDAGATWTATATNGLKNVLPLPSAITTPTGKTMSLRVYGQPSISGNDMFVQATALAQNSDVQVVQPILYPDYPSGCTGTSCTKFWGRAIRIAEADASTASVDTSLFVTTGSGLGGVLVGTTGAGGGQAVTAYFTGTNRVYSLSSPLSAAANTTYSLRPLSSSNFAVRAWLGID